MTLTSVGGNVTMATVTCKAVNTFVDGSTEKTYVCLEGSWSPLVEDCVGEMCVRWWKIVSVSCVSVGGRLCR